MANTKPARGMRDFLPSDVRKRNYVINIIKEVYESYGFEPLETPAVENIETLTGKYGEEGNQLIFKILKRGEKLDTNASEKDLADLALRYDLTVPLARVVANHKNDLPKFFKRYQIQPVWRADRPARGRFREFYQCDVDAIGSSSMIVEAELCAAVSEILTRLGFEDFVIRVNHRKILEAVLIAANVDVNKFTDVLIALDKLDKIGQEGVTKEFIQRGVSPTATEKLLVFFESIIKSDVKSVLGKSPTQSFISLQKQISEIEKLISEQRVGFVNAFKDIFRQIDTKIGVAQKELEMQSSEHHEKKLREVKTKVEESSKRIDKHLIRSESNHKLISLLNFIRNSPRLNEISDEGFSNLIMLLDLVKFSIPVVIDPTLARGLSYYTGAIFEINVPDLAGSLGGGGRYDGLIGMFGKDQIPACGFSLGLERLLVVMEERGMFPKELTDSSADVMVTIWNEKSIGESLKLAAELRQANLRVLVYPEADKLGKQFKYADSIKIPFVCVLGETELAENKVTLKNLRTGAQETIARVEVSKKIK